MPPPPGFDNRPSLGESSSRKRRLRSSVALRFASPSPRVPETPDIADRPRKRKPSYCDLDEPEPDPDYLHFMEHLRLDGQFYIYERGSNSVEYELSGHSVARAGAVMPQEHHQLKKHRRINEAENNAKKTNICETNKRHNTKAASLGKRNRSPSRLSSKKKANAQCSMIDEDYLVFLEYLMEQDGAAALKYDNVTVVYEAEKARPDAREGEKSQEVILDDSDEVIIVEPEKFRKESNTYSGAIELLPYFSSTQPSGSLELQALDVGDHVQVMVTTEQSEFSVRLMSVLDKPFDQKELDRLMTLVSARNFIEKYKHLRNESIPYVTDQMGYSYLDHFSDFARELESADDQKALTLLRGFFFWLENIGHEGAYKPWKSATSDYVTI